MERELGSATTVEYSKEYDHDAQAQVKDNLACVDIRLEPALVQRIDTVSRIEMGFPHRFFANEMVRSLSYGGMWERIDAR